MDKRGQIYILAALLLAVVIYGLSTITNLVEQEEIKGDFEALARNYEVESSKLINSVLQSGGDVPEAFANFTFLFTSYSKAKSPSFNLFYAIAYNDRLYVGNFMAEPITVYLDWIGGGCPVAGGSRMLEPDGCLTDIPARMSFEGLDVRFTPEWDDLFVTTLKDVCIKDEEIREDDKAYYAAIGGQMYNLSIDRNIPRIYSLSRLKSGEQTLLSVGGAVGQQQVCSDFTTESDCESCCLACHWDGECKEGKRELGKGGDPCVSDNLDCFGCIDGYNCVVDTCVLGCTERWRCTSWSDCEGGQQTRICTDQNGCGTFENKPDETRSCSCTDSDSGAAEPKLVKGAVTTHEGTFEDYCPSENKLIEYSCVDEDKVEETINCRSEFGTTYSCEEGACEGEVEEEYQFRCREIGSQPTGWEDSCWEVIYLCQHFGWVSCLQSDKVTPGCWIPPGHSHYTCFCYKDLDWTAECYEDSPCTETTLESRPCPE